MACACKAQKKEVKMNIKEAFREKKGLMFILTILKELVLKIINKLFIVVLFIILTPLITLNLIISYVFTGKLRIMLPKKMLNVARKLNEDE